MLKKNEGTDIVKELGGIQNVEQAQALFEKRLDDEHLSRIRMLTHPEILIKMCQRHCHVRPGPGLHQHRI